jgi:hypoxanthine phosphoribosyltransferase
MKIIGWNELIKLCNDLHNKIMMKTYSGIIPIGRGGTIIGAILASKLGTRLYPVFVLHRGKGSIKTTEIIRLDSAPKLPLGKYLLVDDECYTGETFDLLKKHLPHLRLETASIICRKERYSPDYYVLSIDEETIFPYKI